MIEFLKKETFLKEEFHKINFSTYNSHEKKNKRREIIFNFEKLFIKKGLYETSIGKETLEKILILLENLIKNDKKDLLDKDQLIQLTKLLISENVSQRHKNETDLKEFIIKILLKFQHRRQIFQGPSIQKDLRKYYEENRIHLDKITEFDKSLRQEPRDNQIKGCLISALNYQKDILFSIEKLIPNLKYFDDFIQLLDDYHQKREELEIEKKKLYEKSIKEKDKSVDISSKIIENQQQLNYYTAKAEN